MTKIIQQVHFANGNDLYIVGYDVDNVILRYRTRYSGTQELSEKITIEGDKVRYADGWFPAFFLQKFLIENEIIPEPPTNC
jgi:hypothetical protein